MLRILVLSVLLLPLSAIADSYICVVDNMTGFRAKDNWKPVIFSENFKYIVRPPKAGDFLYEQFKSNNIYVVMEIGGDNVPNASCDRDFDVTGVLTCDGSMTFRMHRHTLNFITVREGGYLYLSDDGTGELSDVGVEIGKCSKI